MPKTSTITPALTVERATLANGLRLVFAPDRSAPAVFVAATYDVGLRSEPEDRTGFAHLFEHLMFEGSLSLERGMHDKLVTGNGGVMNGSTWSDFTNYYETMPSNALELALFLEADRMRGLRLTPESLHNQIEVVKEEIRLKIHNQPYNKFISVMSNATLFETFPNAHDGWGNFEHLEAATLEDAAEFFDRYYAPGNCVVTVTGDFDPDEALRFAERHFGDIPARPVPVLPSFAEPLPKKEKRIVYEDRLAPQPACALAYRMPDPIANFEDMCAAVLLVLVLTDGDASRLFLRLVKEDRSASHVMGDIGAMQGGAFEVRDPAMLRLIVFYPGAPNPDPIIRAIDDEALKIAGGIGDEELERFRNAFLADYLRGLDQFDNRGMAMSSLELQRGRPDLINEIPAALARVTPADVARVAGEWLVPERRAVIDLHPGGGR